MKITYLIRSILSILALLLFSRCTSSDCVDIAPDKEISSSSNSDEQRGIESFHLSFCYNERFTSLGDIAASQEPLLLYVSSRESGETNYIAANISLDSSSITLTNCDGAELSNIPHESHILRYIGIDSNDDGLLSDTERVSVGVLFNVLSATDIELATTVTTRSTTLGAGGADDPYVIATEDDFISLITDKLDAGDNLKGVYFQQTGRITCSKTWSCAGASPNTFFEGNYNGGCTSYNKAEDDGIHNLFITSTNNAAIFYGIGYYGVVEDLGLTNANFFASGSYAASVAAHMDGGAYLKGIKYFSGTVIGSSYVGGLVAEGHGTFKTCYVCCNITNSGTGEYFGGYLGYCNGLSDFEKCIYRGSIDVLKGQYVGGFIGQSSTTAMVELTSCYVCGDITSSRDVGGFIGAVNSPIEMSNCIAGATKNTGEASDTELIKSLTEDDLYNSDTMNQDITISSIYAIDVVTPYTSDDTSNIDVSIGGFFGSLEGDSDSYYLCRLINCSLNYYEAFDSNQATVLINTNYEQLYYDGKEYHNMGGLCGIAEYINFESCSFTNHATIGRSTDGVRYAGGVFGQLTNCTIKSSDFKNSGKVDGGSGGFAYYTGGIAGNFNPDNTSSSISSVSFMNEGAISGLTYTGGIFGCSSECANLPNNITLKNYANVTGSYNVGGLCGYDKGLISRQTDYFLGSANTSIEVKATEYNGGGMCGYTYMKNDINVAGINYITVGGEGEYLGGMFGYLEIKDSEKSIKVTADQHVVVEGSNYVGGLIGYLCEKDVTISTDNHIKGAVKGIGECVGGIVGKAIECEVTFANCYNQVTVSTTSSDDSVIEYGGIVGRVEDSYCTFTQCSNVAEITGGSASTGGLVGIIDCDDSETCKLSECYNSGRITCVAGSSGCNVGGLLGKARSSTHLDDCYNSGEVPSGGSAVGGLVGYFLSVDSKTEKRYQLNYCYNVGSTGYATVGGSSKLCNNELYGVQTYYDSAVSNGDLSDKHKYVSHPKDATWMNSTLNFADSSVHPTIWTDTDDDTLPYLTNVTPADDLPATQTE